MENPRLGVEVELQLQAYATATAMPDPSSVRNIHHSSDPVLLWLWRRLAATAPIRPPSLGTSICRECGPENLFFFFCLFLVLHLWHMEVPRLGV